MSTTEQHGLTVMRQSYESCDLSASRHLVMRYRYRIGDTVALMELMAWVTRHYGAKHWHFLEGVPHMVTLNAFLANRGEFADTMVTAYDERPEGTGLPEESILFDEANLWIWNDAWQKSGHRLDFATADPLTPVRRAVIFAPMLEAEYSSERAMHPTAAIEIARRLEQRYGERFITIRDPNADARPHVRAAFDKIGGQQISADLSEVIRVIAGARAFIGCDTGLSHIAARFPRLRQVALYSKLNLANHRERDFDHLKDDREAVAAYLSAAGDDVPGGYDALEYNALPNKAECRAVLFDDGGCDGVTPDAVMGSLDALGA